MDNYYHDLSKLTLEERKRINFDHPDAFDMELLIHDLEQLLLGNAIEEPIYDFTINTRSKGTKVIGPGDVVILDGIFALENAILRELSTIKSLLIRIVIRGCYDELNAMLVSVIVVLTMFYNNML